MADEATYTFGWRQFRIEVPEPWEPGHLEGDDGRGYVRLDGPLMHRVELKWDRARGENACDDALEMYLKHLEKAAAKGTNGSRFRRKPKEFSLVSSWPEGMKGRTVRWSAEVECVAAFTSCERCERLTAVQVLFPAGELELGVARRALATFRDHAPDEDELVPWGLYRMRFEVPANWRLKEHRFGPGYAEMQFAGPGGLWADIRRAGPAEIILRKRPLTDWFLGGLPKGVKLDPEAIRETLVRGDTVLEAARPPRGILAGLWRRAASTATKLRGLALQSVAWHCPSSNRLWAVHVYAPTLEAAQDADWRVDCHD